MALYCNKPKLTTESLESVTGAGTIESGLVEYSIANVGGAAGLVNGVSFPAGASVTYRAYFAPDNGPAYFRLTGLSYDATGTTFLIAKTP